MTTLVLVLTALFQCLFVGLVVAGVVSAWHRGALFRYRGLRLARLRAAQRFARGELDQVALRQLVAHLQPGARR